MSKRRNFKQADGEVHRKPGDDLEAELQGLDADQELGERVSLALVPYVF